MDNLAASYIFVEHLRYGLESGDTPAITIKKFVREERTEFGSLLEKWLVMSQSENYRGGEFQKSLSLYRKSIFDLLDLSKTGVSIIDPLKSMEKEMVQICENDLQKHLDKLPFQLMIPMLFLQFPAVLLLVIGPLLLQFLAEVGS